MQTLSEYFLQVLRQMGLQLTSRTQQLYLFIYLFLKIYFIYLFLAVLGLHCSARASHCSGFSCCGAWALGAWASVVVARRLSSCGARA